MTSRILRASGGNDDATGATACTAFLRAGPQCEPPLCAGFAQQQADSRRAVFAGLSSAGSMSRQRKPSSTDNLCLEEGGGDNGCSGMPAPGSAAGKRLQNHRNVVQRMQNMVADRRRRNVRFELTFARPHPCDGLFTGMSALNTSSTYPLLSRLKALNMNTCITIQQPEVENVLMLQEKGVMAEFQNLVLLVLLYGMQGVPLGLCLGAMCVFFTGGSAVP